MSLNSKLRKAVYGDTRVARNPLLAMPAGVVGTTWRGTGFEQAPQEPVDLDPAALPWELQEEPATPAPSQLISQPTRHVGRISLAMVFGVIAVAFIALYHGW